MAHDCFIWCDFWPWRSLERTGDESERCSLRGANRWRTCQLSQQADKRGGFNRQRMPDGFVIGELVDPPNLLELTRGGHDGLCIEIRRGALEGMRSAAQSLAVPRIERRSNALQMHGHVINEQPRDLSQELR